MITVKGTYNTANIMIDEIDESAKDQIQTFLNHPAFANTYIAIMPDVHAGKGAVIGFTMKTNGFIIPNVIGVDIGCGMLSAKFKMDSIDPTKLDSFIKTNIPSGFAINKNHNNVSKSQKNEIINVCHRIKTDTDKALNAIGSLGGGNHFIEAGYDSKGNLWITIHSGSRNFGLKIAVHYQNKAKDSLRKHCNQDYKDLEFMKEDSSECQDYLRDLFTAQRFAAANREEMLRRIISFIGKDPEEIIESVHNFIGTDNIIRKGATPAHNGQKVIIPFNMRDGIAICEGKGSEKYNYSAPHGAGRILSRVQAKKQLSADVFRQQMINAGIYTSTASKETLDEAPGAYKDMNLILDNIKETVEIIEMIKPIYNFKAGNE
ncbi:MAG: RtcB family protein [Spirochaetes bacterium]|nr:RtcB family protein [Spirochaetota bacterium]